MTALHIAVNIFILALFLYSKLTSHKTLLTGKYLSVFTFFERLFEPMLGLLRKIVKPTKVGNGIAVDMSHIVLLAILLTILIIF